jgi:hypothetical protein
LAPAAIRASADNDLCRRIEICELHAQPSLRAYLINDATNIACVHPKDRRHTARREFGGALHRNSTRIHDAQCVFEADRLRGVETAVLGE